MKPSRLFLKSELIWPGLVCTVTVFAFPRMYSCVAELQTFTAKFTFLTLKNKKDMHVCSTVVVGLKKHPPTQEKCDNTGLQILFVYEDPGLHVILLWNWTDTEYRIIKKKKI